MKLLFSEYKSDYSNYIFPYAIWAIPDPGDKAAKIFAGGFLPASRHLDRYYMCRQVRVNLKLFNRSSENRRILRKGSGITFSLIPRDQFEFTLQRREFYKNYADIKFGNDVMTHKRLDSLFNSKIISHLLLFTDNETKKEVGTATLLLDNHQMAYYYYAFYDLNYYRRNLGMYMMTAAVDFFAKQNYDFLYLGTCYSRNALYKTQFKGAEFFNGSCWSQRIQELKYLIEREKKVITKHLLETDEFLEKFYDGELKNVIKKGESGF